MGGIDFGVLLAYLAASWPFLVNAFAFLGLIVVVLKAVVKLTPTQKDDAMLAQILSIPVLGSVLSSLVVFSPIEKKPGQ